MTHDQQQSNRCFVTVYPPKEKTGFPPHPFFWLSVRFQLCYFQKMNSSFHIILKCVKFYLSTASCGLNFPQTEKKDIVVSTMSCFWHYLKQTALQYYSNSLSNSFTSYQNHVIIPLLKPSQPWWNKIQSVWWILSLFPNKWQQEQGDNTVDNLSNQGTSTPAICPLQRSLIEMGALTAAIQASLSPSVSTSSPVLMLTGWLCYSCALMCEEPADSVFAEQARHQGICPLLNPVVIAAN